MNSLLSKEKQIVVFDIGSKNIKIVKGTYNDGIINVDNYDIISTSTPFIENGRVMDKAGLTKELSKLRLKVKSKDIRLLLSSKDIILRTFILPVMEREEIREAVKFEMSVFLPEEIEHYIIDGTAVREFKDENEDNTMIEVQGVAIEKNIVTDYLDCFSKAGFKISVVDIQPNAILKLVCHESHYLRKKDGSSLEKQNISVIDIGNEKISLTFIENNSIFIHRTLNKGARDLDSKQQLQDGKNEIFFDIVTEINQLIEYFISMSKNKQLNYIAVLGGGSLVLDIAEHIEEIINIQTESIHSLHNVHFKDLKSPDHINLLANVIGAFIRRR